MLPGMIPFVGFANGVPNVSIGTPVKLTDDSNTDTYTWASTSLGDAAADRVMIAVASVRGFSNTAPVEISIGATTMTLIVSSDDTTGDQDAQASIHAVAYPTGTTDTVEMVGGSGGDLRDGVVWLIPVYGYSATAYDSDVDQATSGSSSSVTIGHSAYNFVIGVFALRDTTSTTSWTGLTEIEDDEFSDNVQSYAYDEFTVADASLTVSVTHDSNDRALAVAAFPPA